MAKKKRVIRKKAPEQIMPKKRSSAGLPEMFTKEWCDREAEIFFEWLKLPSSIFFKTFCFERGYGAQRLTEFAEKSERFSEVLKIAHSWQEQRLMVGGLTNTFNASITKLALSKHGYHDKEKETPKEAALDALTQLLLNASGKSKALVDDPDDSE